MNKQIKYAILKTRWGWFGLAADENALIRTHLPASSRQAVKTRLLKGLSKPQYDADLFKRLQSQVITYFAGSKVDFTTGINVSLDGLPEFAKRVLVICRGIPYGRTTTYSQLAVRLGKPKAARAVGNALANNPIPLIIPCHRVLRSDGSLGGFSAPGGTATKAHLLALERRAGK